MKVDLSAVELSLVTCASFKSNEVPCDKSESSRNCKSFSDTDEAEVFYLGKRQSESSLRFE